jgi:hypothetical protein
MWGAGVDLVGERRFNRDQRVLAVTRVLNWLYRVEAISYAE